FVKVHGDILLRGRRTKRRIKQKLNSVLTRAPQCSVPTTRENAPASLNSLRFSPDQIQLHHANVVAALADLQIRNLEYRHRVCLIRSGAWQLYAHLFGV